MGRKVKYKYIFKYNKEGELYNYVELNRNSKVLSYYDLSGDTLIRYNKDMNTKHYIKYAQNVNMMHRYECGESWITMSIKQTSLNNYERYSKFPEYYPENTSITGEIIPPTIENQILLEENQIYRVALDSAIIKDWAKLIKSEVLSKENYKTSSKPISV